MKYSTVSIVLYLVFLIQIHQFSSSSQGLVLASVIHRNKLAPALYVFGDSLVDINYTPYGVDYPNGASGRFTNVYTTVDYLVSNKLVSFGKPFVPPIVRFVKSTKQQKSKITTGINYASGAAGILPGSGIATKVFYMCKHLLLPLSNAGRQLELGRTSELLPPTRYDSSKIYTPKQYGALLISCLNWVQLPLILNSVNPRPTTPYLKGVNIVVIFNFGITNMIQELTSTLKGSTFVCGDIFEKTYQQDINPLIYDFSEGNAPCYSISNASSLCLPNQTPCTNRNAYLHWDGYHPTQRVNYEIASGCFRGSSTCLPINVQKLSRI
ncbi:hypothetical protein MKW98_028768 [Papaver atlanticum]|uniref:GDSL esterase/lipase n=1 Tax=Papaver atlanticum TaxID=357466 RepID=A0AAD4S9Q9_9MAGN|nr:hypothetical protein MKW98_028768 [Papaver atlanticum]